MAEKSGYVMNDPDYGSIFIGSDEGVKGVQRPRHVAVQSAAGGALKLFKDGGFEIQSQPSAKLGDNIVSRSQDGLFVKGRNIHFDATDTITISARSIVIEGTGGDRNVVVRSGGNLIVQAADTLTLKGSVVGVGGHHKVIINSSGSIYARSRTGISLVEPQTPLTPTALLDVIDTLTQSLFSDTDCEGNPVGGN